MRILKKVAAVLLLLFLIAGCSLLALRKWPWFFGSYPQFGSLTPNSMKIETAIWMVDEGSVSVEVKELNKCVMVLNSLRLGRNSQEHQCLNSGKLIIVDANGKAFDIGLLSGRDPNRFEFRYMSSIYSMPREQFMSAMRSAGITDNVLTKLERR